MSFWAKHCRPGPCVHGLFCGLLRQRRPGRWKRRTAQEEELLKNQFSVYGWDYQPDVAGDDLGEEGFGPVAGPGAPAGREGPPRAKSVTVTTMSGTVVASLPALQNEAAAELKRRIQREEGTAPHMQKLIQGCRVLEDSDVVVPGKPVALVRVQRKLAIFASVHSDLRFYDVETGEAMRSAGAQNLRLSCLAADWDTSRCFTGSSDGVVRVWDFLSGELIQTLLGHRQAVCALCVGGDGKLVAVAKDGAVRKWSVHNTAPLAFIQTETRGDIVASVGWSRNTVLLAGDAVRHEVVAHDLDTGARLWDFRLEGGPTAAIAVDWPGERCLVAPRWGLLELWVLGPAGPPVAKFGPRRLNQRGLMRVDWAEGRLAVVAEPYALEMWSLRTFEMLYRLRDCGGDDTEVVSLDVNWALPVPQAVVCRHYVDWDLVAGEVCIQHWELQEPPEGGQPRNVCADHPMVGGFDIVAAMAQL